jgi:fumarate hydratase subunit alpha
MRSIHVSRIRDLVSQLCVKSNTRLRPDVLSALKKARRIEKGKKSGFMLDILIKNAETARKESMAICQDTGVPEVFVDIGQDTRITGGDLTKAINDGIRQGYKKGFLRNSIVEDPVKRGKPKYSPGVIHYKIVKGSRISINVAPKGFGSENKSKTRMFDPTASTAEIEDYITECVKEAGPDACPPYIIGIGMGGTLDKACILAKTALFEPIDKNNPKKHIADMEKSILKKVNRLNIGPIGVKGQTTALAVKILTFPTHIAGLPVCINSASPNRLSMY